MKVAVVAAWIAVELARLPGSRTPGETREEYVERAKEVGMALAVQAQPFANGSGWAWTELAAAGAVIWHGETLLDKRIQAGEPHPVWDQDKGLARCGMQLHTSGLVPQDVWMRLVGAGEEPLNLCAQYGLRVVVAQAKQCGVFFGVRADRNRVAKMLAGYATGGKCVPTDREWQRADRWLKMMAKRPDHEKKLIPGYRRVGPADVPVDVRTAAEAVAVGVRSGAVALGHREHTGAFALIVEKHANGKPGVSVFMKE